MTSGRHKPADDAPRYVPSEDEVRAVLAHPAIAAQMCWAPVIIEDFDCPDLGGSSTAPELIVTFMDRSIAKAKPKLKRTGLEYEQWRSAIGLHEQFERLTHHVFGWPYDVDGPSCHGYATALEHMQVKHKLNADPQAYEDDLADLIDAAESEVITKPALDLWCFPYYSDPDERDVRILQRLAELGVKDAMHHPVKLDHVSVFYGPKQGAERCGVCSRSDHGNPPHCELVADPIDPNMWCALFKKEDRK